MRPQHGFTLLELLISTATLSIVFALAMSGFLFNTQSFLGAANYVDLDKKSRNALDLMSKEIRRSHWLTGYDTNYLTFEDFDGNPLTYSYDSTARALTRTQNGVTDATPLLSECNFLQFGIYQRNPIGGTYDQFPTAVSTNCKLVQVTWICSRNIRGTQMNTETVQSAKIVIRTR